ncbi:MAG: hypothetical protein IPN76_19150 [Saprospiraceae bacterium]|nr:hypothetical protein [Saprospiraceae bacterium]
MQGQVFFDENNDCLPTANEQHFGGWHLTATKIGTGGGVVFHGITDHDGRFSILTDTQAATNSGSLPRMPIGNPAKTICPLRKQAHLTPRWRTFPCRWASPAPKSKWTWRLRP